MARVRPLPVTGASGRLYPADTVAPTGAEWGYHGFALTNTSPLTSYRMTLHDETGLVLDIIEFAPGESVREFYPGGVAFLRALYVTFLPDTAEGVVVGSLRIG